MGFCKLCGSICTGTRCKCGGSVAAPVVRWAGSANKSGPLDSNSDALKTSKPVLNKVASGIAAFENRRDVTPSKPDFSLSTSKRFPRPLGTTPALNTTPKKETPLGNRITSHIASTTINTDQSPSHTALSNPDPSIVLSDTGSFAKVYGSVLQDPATLASFVCSGCEVKFLPDATLYPSLEKPGDYFCKPCFEIHGGSRGPCEACGRDVIKLKSEGGFIENAGRVWHQKCFKCEGCLRDIGHRPMVDILGRPCCADCFDDCLKRGTPSPQRGTPKSKASVGMASPSRDKPGGLKLSSRNMGEETSSPVVEELARRIGAPSPNKTQEFLPAPGVVLPSRLNLDALNQTMSAKLAAARFDKSPEMSARSLSAASDTSSKRIPSANFESPARSSTSLSSSPSPIQMPLALPEPVKTPSLSRKLSDIDKSLALPPVTSNTTGGLLTPTSTPTQSPASSPHSIQKFALEDEYQQSTLSTSVEQQSSTPASVSKIPSLSGLGRKSLTMTPGSRPSVDLSNRWTPTRIPSLSSSRPLPATPSNSTPIRDINPAAAFSPETRREPLPSGQTTPHRPSVSIPPQSLLPQRDANCRRCAKPLFSIKGGGKIVTLPHSVSDGVKDVETGDTESYHADCFKCDACEGSFQEKDGLASFVRFEGGARHLECTPSKVVRTFVRKESSASQSSIPISKATPPKLSTPKPRPTSLYHSTYSSPSKPTTPSTPTVGSNSENPSSSIPRFGSVTTCPGCRISVSPMERGIVPGPEASKWHAGCLVCGGKNGPWKDRFGKTGLPGCGKKLDSAAKGSVGDRVLWCRDCWDQVRSAPSPGGPLSSQGVIAPSHTGGGSQGTNIFPTARPGSGLSSAMLGRPPSRGAGNLSPIRRNFQFPQSTESGEGESGDEVPEPRTVAKQNTETRGTSIRRQHTGTNSTGERMATTIRRQYTGSINAPLRQQFTGSVDDSAIATQPVAVQYTGNGVPITRQLTARRPKSALGMSRSFGSQKSIDESRGLAHLTRQVTGQSKAS